MTVTDRQVGQSATKPRRRESYIDILRAAAIARVLFYHATELAWLTVVFPAMGVMFAVAGSLTARSLTDTTADATADAGGTRGRRSATRVVISRFRRLLPSVWAFAVLALVASYWLGWGTGRSVPDRYGMLWWVLPLSAPTRVGGEDALVFTGVMWYLTAYLWFVLLSPMLLRLLQTWPRATLAVAVAAPLVLHVEIVTIGGPMQPEAYDLTQYVACWLIGMAHREGWLAEVRDVVFWPIVMAIGLLTVAAVLATGQPVDSVNLHQLPTMNGLWSAAFAAAVLRLAPADGGSWASLPRNWVTRAAASVVAVLNARAVTIYLWHYPSLLLARWLTGFDPVAGPWLWPTGALMVAFTGLAVLAVGWIEDVAARRPVWRPWTRWTVRRPAQASG